MITPRRTQLVRVPDLFAFRHAIATLGASRSNAVVVVPTRGAAAQLAAALPAADLVTRDELYDRLHARLADPPRRLNAFERDAVAHAATRTALAAEPELSFRLRPGLVAEILAFYDLLDRQAQTVQRFQELIEETLGPPGLSDAGAERLMQQTRFLAEAFREYERRVRATGGVDEHALRTRLVNEAAPDPLRHVVVTVADWIADPDGLFVADFDLLSRIPGLDSLDIVATEATLGSGFHERLHSWWPGLAETDAAGLGIAPRRTKPMLMTPAETSGALWFTRRDREEELVEIARRIRADRRLDGPSPLARKAVVYKRPLPYLYVAADTLGAAGIPFHTADALPLAAEPFAAAVDIALEFVSSGFTRSATLALLRSPHFRFDIEGRSVTRAETNALDRTLSGARYLGDLSRLVALAADPSCASARPTIDLVVTLGRELAPIADPHPAAEQVQRLADFLTSHAAPLDDTALSPSRDARARAAVMTILSELARSHAACEPVSWTIEELAGSVRRWIEEATFVADEAAHGVHLLDDRAARFGDFDELTIVGVVEGDWPEKPRRNIFYPSNLMKALGWPSEKDRRAAAEARFLDLLAVPAARVAISVPTLDDEALIEPSSLLDEIPRARLSTMPAPSAGDARVFVDEALSRDPVRVDVVAPAARAWVALRTSRSPADAPVFHGSAGSPPVRAWSISALETYISCPFKFFAQHVLRLEEEPDDEEVMDPRAQGRFVHEVFEEFFRRWQQAGHGAVAPDNLEEARAMFTDVVDERLDEAGLSAAEAALERTRLLGSPAASGLGEGVLRMEAERPVGVIERLLEHELRDTFTIHIESGDRKVALRGKADRIDLLADGTFRLIDYKLGWPPDRSRALQLPIYSVCAEQALRGRHGREWRVREAAYLAFKGPKRVVPLFTSDDKRAEVLAAAQQRLADTLDAIARGEFPPTPDDVYRCETCSFSAVCRKDYVGDV